MAAVISLILWIPNTQAQRSHTRLLKKTIPAQSPLPPWSEVLKLYKQRAWKHVILQLTPVVAAKTNDQEYRKRAWFLLGQSYLALKEYQYAQTSFRTGQKLDNKYPNLWTYHQMRTYLQSSEYEKAIPLIKALLQPPVNAFYLKKIKANIKNFYNTQETIPLIYPVLHAFASQPSLLLHDHEIINIYAKGASFRKTAFPQQLYITQWLHPENRKTAEESDTKIEELINQKLIRPTAAQYLKRFNALEKLKLYRYLTQVIPKQIHEINNFRIRAQVGNIYLRTLFKEKRYNKILELRKKNILTNQYKAFQTSQLFWSMRSYQRLNRLGSAKRMLAQLEQTNPASTWRPTAYRKMAESYEVQENEKRAGIWWKKVTKAFPGTKEAEVAYWKMTWLRYRHKRYSDALYYVNQALKHQTLSPEVLAKFLYWKGKLQYLLGKKKEAAQTLKGLQRNWPNTYYNFRFLSQPADWVSSINTLGTPPPQRTLWHSDPPPPLGKIKELTNRHEFLFMIGENEHAVFELQKDTKKHHKYAIIWKSSELLYEYSEFHELQTLISDYYLLDLKKLPIENQRAWQFAYPRPYWPYIQKQSKKTKLDPYWILAIIREESRYDPMALSVANARGLMQLISPTAKQVARQQKVRLKNINRLYDPSFNILLGSSYLGKLATRFGNELIYAAGGYNAGPHRMKKWRKSFGKLPMDEFVESIPFRETRNYVKRVFTTYTIYKKIYADTN